jgi:hypothetical protein
VYIHENDLVGVSDSKPIVETTRFLIEDVRVQRRNDKSFPPHNHHQTLGTIDPFEIVNELSCCQWYWARNEEQRASAWFNRSILLDQLDQRFLKLHVDVEVDTCSCPNKKLTTNRPPF